LGWGGGLFVGVFVWEGKPQQGRKKKDFHRSPEKDVCLMAKKGERARVRARDDFPLYFRIQEKSCQRNTIEKEEEILPSFSKVEKRKSLDRNEGGRGETLSSRSIRGAADE